MYPAPVEFAAAYQPFATALAARVKGSGAYVYPLTYTHVTVVSPAPFTDCKIESPADRAAFVQRFTLALRDTCTPANGFPTASFPLVFDKLKLERRAAIFLISDPTGAVERIRRCIRLAMESHEALTDEEGARLLSLSGLRIPNIVHITVMRFTRDIPVVADSPDGWDEARMRKAFDEVAATWEPLTVNVPSMRLVEECVPYMHLDISSTHPHCLLAEFAFA